MTLPVILNLTEKEAYILSCVMGHVRWGDDPDVKSLLGKLDNLTEELDMEDYEQVKFSADMCGLTTIDFIKNEEK